MTYLIAFFPAAVAMAVFAHLLAKPATYSKPVPPAERVEVAARSKAWRIYLMSALVAWSLLVVAAVSVIAGRANWVPLVLS